MSYLAHRKDFGPCIDATAEALPAAAPEKAGLLRRVFNAVFQSRQRQIDREIGAYLANTGGRLTDSAEREMMHLMTRSSWSTRL